MINITPCQQKHHMLADKQSILFAGVTADVLSKSPNNSWSVQLNGTIEHSIIAKCGYTALHLLPQNEQFEIQILWNYC